MSVHIERRVGWKLWHHKKEDTPEEAYKREIGPPNGLFQTGTNSL
jgi:hypothetical protein